MRIRLLVLIFILIFNGCVFFQVETTIITPEGDVWVIKSKSDALVEFKEADRKILVDNRGLPGALQQALTLMFLNLPDVTVGTSGIK